MNEERDAAIVVAVANGERGAMTVEAERWGISRERVRQICKRVGLTARLLRDAKYEEARAAIATAPACYGIVNTARALHISDKVARRLDARPLPPSSGNQWRMAARAAERREAIRVLREQGMSTSAIMAETGLSRTAVCRHLRRLGTPAHKTGRPRRTI